MERTVRAGHRTSRATNKFALDSGLKVPERLMEWSRLGGKTVEELHLESSQQTCLLEISSQTPARLTDCCFGLFPAAHQSGRPSLLI